MSQSEISEKLLDEVRELMFNEEFRTLIRRNLFSLDSGDDGLRMAQDILQSLKNSKSLADRRDFGGVFA